MSDIAALILAGGTNTPEMRAACGGVENRALVAMAEGRTMLDLVVDAVRGGMAGRGRVLVAGEVPTPAGCTAVPGGASLVDTLLAGVAALDPDESRLLVATADIPFLTAEAVADFLRRAEAAPAHFTYPILEADACAARFPGMRRTTLRIAEGTFTGGNLALLDPAFLRAHDGLIRSAYARRKSVVALGRLLGPALLLRLLASRLAPGVLAVRHLEEAIGRLLGGGTARAVVSPFPEIGADVDKPEDVALARKILAAPPRV